MLFSKRARLSATVAAMRGPRRRRSPAAGRQDRASITLTGKLDNPLDSVPDQANQAQRWQRLSDVAAEIAKCLRRQRELESAA